MFYVSCLVGSFIIFWLFLFGLYAYHGWELSQVTNHMFTIEFKGWFITAISGLTFGGVIFLIVQWQEALQRVQKLKEESLIFQNETLKNQINPHFLFNSLNTLNSLIQSKPELAEKFISRLSSIYRYIIENFTVDQVPLQAELDFIRDYFYLHQIRDEDKIRLTIDISETGHFMILPVSLQLLVENAIKHNMATRIKPLFIHIYLSDKFIVVENTLQKMSVQYNTGAGLNNLKQRVLLSTGKQLIVEETSNLFTVKIPLIV